MRAEFWSTRAGRQGGPTARWHARTSPLLASDRVSSTRPVCAANPERRRPSARGWRRHVTPVPAATRVSTPGKQWMSEAMGSHRTLPTGGPQYPSPRPQRTLQTLSLRSWWFDMSPVRQLSSAPTWYVASFADGQTHLADPAQAGLVDPRCERIPFRPLAALTGTPLDPAQICSSCLAGYIGTVPARQPC